MNRRAKGFAFQKLVATMLRAVYPTAQSAGHERGQPDVIGVGDFWIETRHRNAASIPGLLREAVARSSAVVHGPHEGKIPLVVTRTNRGEIVASMRLADLVVLLGRYRDAILAESRYNASANRTLPTKADPAKAAKMIDLLYPRRTRR